MDNLVFKRRRYDRSEFVGEFTQWCDTMIVFDIGKYPCSTYIMDADVYNPNIYPIRFPGATRGHIQTDENRIIQDIQFYSSSGIASNEPHNVGIYKNEIKELCKQFIGRKLIIDEAEEAQDEN